MIRARSNVASVTAALLALLLLSYASVQSIVMKATMTPSGDVTAMCDGPAEPAPTAMSMPGMAMDGMAMAASVQQAYHANPPHGHKEACPYCAAAAHAPIVGSAKPLRHAVGFVFAAFRVVACHGPRGPPTCQPRARGPPADPLTA